MNHEERGFLNALKKNPSDYLCRGVYADYLDENGRPEEASRQRKYEKSEKWLMMFALTHSERSFHNWPMEAEQDIKDRDTSYGKLMIFLDAVLAPDGVCLPFNTPDQDIYDDVTPELWDHFEVVSGKEVPAHVRERDSRSEWPYIRCAC